MCNFIKYIASACLSATGKSNVILIDERQILKEGIR